MFSPLSCNLTLRRTKYRKRTGDRARARTSDRSVSFKIGGRFPSVRVLVRAHTSNSIRRVVKKLPYKLTRLFYKIKIIYSVFVAAS